MPHPEFGYRSEVQAYELSKDAHVAFGITKANPHIGVGGLPQIYNHNYKDNLIPLYTIKLKN